MDYPTDSIRFDEKKFATVARESNDLSGVEFTFSERHLQCVWYDEKWRPASLTTVNGEKITVINPGSWNREAGPDFIGAELEVGKSRRRLRGDVEIHIRPENWTAHHHGTDSRYSNVVLHVTYFPESTGFTDLPSHILRLSLRAPLAAKSSFSFEDIDITAYPHAIIPDSPRPCGAALASMSPNDWASLLVSAGRHRLHLKSLRIAARINTVGDKYQVFYEETMAMLGAKRNSGPFRRIAERFPLTAWNGNIIADYASLLGSAGLLPMPERMRTKDAHTFASGLWTLWFKSGGAAVDGLEWSMNGIRPLNHPLRRLAAAAALFNNPHAIADALMEIQLSDPSVWMKKALNIFSSIPSIPFWVHRQTFESENDNGCYALIGRARAAALITNLVVPFIMTERPDSVLLVDSLPPEDVGATARETAYRLFGRDHNQSLYANSGIKTQGLIAIFREFCLGSRGGCLECPLARYITNCADK